jgi:pimeloyl-ACP methyl ester carboxylesterase
MISGARFSSQPLLADRPLWGDLPRGSYAVGYQSSFHLDYARTYDLYFPNPPAARKTPRPILVNVWYPADPAPAIEPLRQGDYLQIATQGSMLGEFSRRLEASHREMICGAVLGKPLSELDAHGRASFERFCETPTAVFRDAPPVEGRFPLLLNHSGYGGFSIDNTVLFEFLASHGYVVVSSAYQSTDAAELRIGHDVDRSNRDLTYLLHHMQHDPRVDMERIGAIGCSYGAQAVLAWVAETDPAIGAVVSLDTTLEYVPLDREEYRTEDAIHVNVSLRDVRTRFDNAPHLSIPMLIFTQARLAPDFALYEKLPCCERYFAQVKFVNHFHFDTLVPATSHLRPAPAEEDGVGNAQQIQEACEAWCVLTLCFLNAQLKGDSQALTCLRSEAEAALNDTLMGKDRGAGMVTWEYRKAEPPPGKPAG